MKDKIGLIKERRAHKVSKMRILLTKRIAFMMAPLVLLTCEQTIQPAQAILNCFTPNMFKFNKGGQQPLVYNAGERANWYPQAQGYQPADYSQMAYGAQHQHPLKMLFRPKWKAGSMFGAKGWNAGWKMGQPGAGFYRPGSGYGYGYGGYGGPNLIPPATTAAGGSYIPGFSEQLHIPPFSIPAQTNSYSSQGDGWSVPFQGYPSFTSGQLQQTQLGSYGEGGYTPSPGVQPGKPTTDPYGTKGASTIRPGGNKLYTTTKKPKY